MAPKALIFGGERRKYYYGIVGLSTRISRNLYDIIHSGIRGQMKILVLSNDVAERKLIQQVAGQDGHEIIPAGDSETAIELLREGEVRFVIADRVTTDIEQKQFIKRTRDAKPPYYIYILLLTARVEDS